MINQDLDSRCFKIIETLINRDTFLSLQEISIFNNVSRRTIYYDLEHINDFLEDNGLEKIIVERGKGISLPVATRESISSYIIDNNSHIRNFRPSERVKIIICTVLKRDRMVLIDDLIDLCYVSRNTILNDLKIVARELGKYQLELNYSSKKGYYITGNVIRKRAVFFLFFDELSDLYRNGEIKLDNQEQIRRYLGILHLIENELNYEFVYGVCYSLAVFFSTIEHRKDPLIFDENLIMKVVATPEYQLVDRYFDDFSSFEKVYLSLHILGSRLQSLNIDFESQFNDEIYDLSCDLVEEFERLANVDFDHRKELEQALYYHLKNSIYRYRYGILIGNPLLVDVKREYGHLFALTKKAVQYLQDELAVPIHDFEIAYLTLHFGGALNNQRKLKKKSKRILVVCPNGLSTANMLKAEISYLIQSDSIIFVHNINELDENVADYDLIVTTVSNSGIDSDKIIVVNPILTDMDRMLIMKKFFEDDSHDDDLSDLMGILKPFLKDNTADTVKEELFKYLNYRDLNAYRLEDNSVGAREFLINRQFVRISKGQPHWSDSIEQTCEILEERDYVNRLYAKNIVRQLKKYGPYMFINEGVCLAHSKISDGSLKLGLSLSVYPDGIDFGRGKVAYLVFVMSAEDQTKHLKLLTDLINLFNISQKLEQLLTLETVNEIVDFFDKNL